MTDLSQTLRIHEIYETIQGESLDAGLPCLMVRLTGCPLRCHWCDTTEAFTGGETMTIADITARVHASQATLVEITGGEPLAQVAVYPLMQAILEQWQASGAKRRLLLETSGAISLAKVPAQVIKIVDVKCPGSGEVQRNKSDHADYLKPWDQLKFVIADRADFDWAKTYLQENPRLQQQPLLFSTVHGHVQPRHLAAWIVAELPQARLQLQLHKYIWPDKTAGV